MKGAAGGKVVGAVGKVVGKVVGAGAEKRGGSNKTQLGEPHHFFPGESANI